MKQTIVFLLLLGFVKFGFTQHYIIRGTVRDSSIKKGIENASVTVFRAKDSLLLSFTRTTPEGRFKIDSIFESQIFVMVYFPGYAEFVDTMDISKIDSTVSIFLSSKAKILQEIIVHQKIEWQRIKGDTIEYKADSFYVPVNASVEDLLKKLPGLKVNRLGTITSQGEAVNRVLVDGEEFFGNDPTLTTRNVRADMIDKVQVYDAKSNQRTTTAIDNGVRVKTINLKLKADKKDISFGKAKASVGTDAHYDNSLMANKFKDKKKLAIYGIHSNIGNTKLNSGDQNNYGDNLQLDLSGLTDDIFNKWNGQYSGNGHPTALSGGVHFNNKFDTDKQSINVNYKGSTLEVEGNKTTNALTLLPENQNRSLEVEKFRNDIQGHNINGKYELMIDSTSNLNVSFEGAISHKTTLSEYLSKTYRNDSILLNEGQRDRTTESGNESLFGNINWQKKLNKKGRWVSLDFKMGTRQINGDGYLSTLNKFYSDSSRQETFTEQTDQYKTLHYNQFYMDGKAEYTEPLGNDSYLLFNFKYTDTKSSSERNSYDKSSTGKYDQFNDSLSNNYSFFMSSKWGGIGYMLIKNKFYIISNFSLMDTHFRQQVVSKYENALERHFNFVIPSTEFSYSFSKQARMYYSYNGSVIPPTVQQIQPIVTNNDPLNVFVGNPLLKPAFKHLITGKYSNYKTIEHRNFLARASFGFVNNAITSKDEIDSLGRRIVQSINTNGNYNLSLYSEYEFIWEKPDFSIKPNIEVKKSKYSNIVNQAKNSTVRTSIEGGLDFYIAKDKLFEIDFNTSFLYVQSTSSLGKNNSFDFTTWHLQPDLSLFLPCKFRFDSDLDYYHRQQSVFGQVYNDIFIVNATLSKILTKNNALSIKLTVKDIFNNNRGIERSESTNAITQNTYDVIRRFGLISLQWDFSKSNKKVK
ncbi:TonB-dependent receptor [Pinibacter aurantiacus]|uniref:TonB-dependent receptor family protein n=1 Tax=Pinibacter aurantiacus TaxID=2851599 RepID=A0A9E2S715_9BACT|nr:TonB-dependent receptor [Pinibacter aurantiacus]MBV4357336.1 TonB-dependent receptor family protein [Pinibacter aurantiacus]